MTVLVADFEQFEQRVGWGVHLGDGHAGLHPELVLLRLRDHADPVRHPVEAVREHLLPGRRDVDQLGVRVPGADLRSVRRRLANSREVHTRLRRGE